MREREWQSALDRIEALAAERDAARADADRLAAALDWIFKQECDYFCLSAEPPDTALKLHAAEVAKR